MSTRTRLTNWVELAGAIALFMLFNLFVYLWSNWN